MKKSRYTEEQIVRILHETNRDTIAEVAKRNGVSEASIYVWRKPFAGMDTDDVKRRIRRWAAIEKHKIVKETN